jgi:hypothetical protein
MSDINAWDDAEYMNEGRELTQGKLPQFTDEQAEVQMLIPRPDTSVQRSRSSK